METVNGTGASQEGTQGKIPPPPGTEAGRVAPTAPPGYYPPYGGWYSQPPAFIPAPEPRRSGKPRIVGILLIFSGILSIIMGSTMGLVMYNVVPWAEQMQDSMNDVGEMQGQVIYQNSTPAAGVNVTVVDLSLAAVTNETGNYRILSVKTGWHDLKVEMPAFKSLIKSVYVGPGTQADTNIKPTKVDFQLQPGDGEVRLGQTHTPGSKEAPWSHEVQSMLNSIGAICLVGGIIGGVLAVLGGYFALRTERLPIVALGTIAGILSIGFGLGSVLSFIALIVLLLCTEEFERAKKGAAGSK